MARCNEFSTLEGCVGVGGGHCLDGQAGWNGACSCVFNYPSPNHLIPQQYTTAPTKPLPTRMLTVSNKVQIAGAGCEWMQPVAPLQPQTQKP